MVATICFHHTCEVKLAASWKLPWKRQNIASFRAKLRLLRVISTRLALMRRNGADMNVGFDGYETVLLKIFKYLSPYLEINKEITIFAT